jgi:hypothetical protein
MDDWPDDATVPSFSPACAVAVAASLARPLCPIGSKGLTNYRWRPTMTCRKGEITRGDLGRITWRFRPKRCAVSKNNEVIFCAATALSAALLSPCATVIRARCSINSARPCAGRTACLIRPATDRHGRRGNGRPPHFKWPDRVAVSHLGLLYDCCAAVRWCILFCVFLRQGQQQPLYEALHER